MKKFFSSGIVKLIVFAAIVISAYFINVEMQKYLGRQALQKAGLTSLPFEQALNVAKKENKMVLVDVSAIWCSTCRKLDNEVFADQEVKDFIGENLVFSRLEYESDEGQKFLEKYDASGFPDLWLIDGDGKVFKHLSVTFNTREFLDQIRN